MVAKRARRRTTPQWPLVKVLRTGVGPVLFAIVSMIGTVVALDHGRTSGGSRVVTTSTSTSLPPTTTAPASVTLSAVGDTELGNTPSVPANPVSWFAPVRAALSAQIEFANLEGTMTSATTSKCGSISTNCYAFRVPPSFAAAYRQVGFTVLNSANNHSHDFGAAGATQTTQALLDAGIVQAGLPGQIGIVRVGSTKVAFCDFAPYENTNDMLSASGEQALIAKAKTMASVVVVYMHSGAEGTTADHVTKATETYFGENRGNPYQFAHAAVDDGANLVIASGPHVLRGMEFYKGVLIDYSLGDFTNFHNFATVGDLSMSGILHVTLSSHGTFQSARFTSVTIASSGQAFVDPTNQARTFVNSLSKADFASAAALITASGQVVPAN